MSLRKWKPDLGSSEKDEDQLLVFGYQCKLFRDDEKAMTIDRGKHLIPWMGDATLMIDRYDGRGHISDLRPFDAEFVDTSVYHMTDKEVALEKACDGERYLELHTDVREQQVYEEEEMKRLYEAVGEGYSAVGFNYGDVPPPDHADQDNGKDEEEDDEPYRTIPELEVPKGVNLPKTMKEHARIEKTAAFICSQGAQMEIVIATKQKNNQQFNFLNYDHELNVYYRHIVRKIQKGRYQARPQEYYVRKKEEDMEIQKPPTPLDESPPKDVLASIRDKLPQFQVHNTSYGRLLQNLQRHVPSPPSSPAQPEQSIQSVNSNGEGAAKKSSQPSKLIDSKPGNDSTGSKSKPSRNAGKQLDDLDDYHDWFNREDYDHEKYAQYYTYYYTYAESIGYNGKDAENYGAHYAHEQVVLEMMDDEKSPAAAEESDPVVSTVSKPVEPPSELKLIIDKMASYVMRNGEDFELLMRGKKDQRFSFLEPTDRHNAYYRYVKSTTRLDLEEEGEEENALAREAIEKIRDLEKPSKTGLSFKIRPKDGGEMNGGTGPFAKSMSGKKPSSSTSLELKEVEGHKKLAALIGAGGYSSGDSSEEEEEEKSKPNSDSETPKKVATEELKNRLAQVARGALMQGKEEEKTKKDERKKKVAMFKALLKSSSSSNLSPKSSDAVPSVSQLPSAGESAPNLVGMDSSPESSPAHRTRTSSASSSSSSSSSSSTASAKQKASAQPVQNASPEDVAASPNTANLEIFSRWSRSPSQSKIKPGSLSSLLLADRDRLHKSNSKARSRSRSQSRRHARRRRHSRHRRRSPLLPSAYSTIRRSISPPTQPTLHRSPRRQRSRDRKSRRSRSRDRRMRKKPARHQSRSRHRKRPKSRSRSRSEKRKKSRKTKRTESPKKKRRKPEPVKQEKKRLKSSSDSSSEEEVLPETVVKFVTSSGELSPDKSSSSPDIAKESQVQIEKLKDLINAKKEEILKDDQT